MVKVMSAPVIIAFCVVGLIYVFLNEKIDIVYPIVLFLLGIQFEELRRLEKAYEAKSGDERRGI